MILIEFCEHNNLSNSCSICRPNPKKAIRKLIERAQTNQEDCKYIDEGYRCKYCDLEVLTKPSRRTYKCSVCLNMSHKDREPNYEFPRLEEPEYYRPWLLKPADILRFRRERWNKIPDWRQQEILENIANIINVWKFYNESRSWEEYNQNQRWWLLSKVKLSAWYLEFYENWFIFLERRPGFCKIPKKINHRGVWTTD